MHWIVIFPVKILYKSADRTVLRLFCEVLSKPVQFPGAYKQLHHLSAPEHVSWNNQSHQEDVISLKVIYSPCKFKL